MKFSFLPLASRALPNALTIRSAPVRVGGPAPFRPGSITLKSRGNGRLRIGLCTRALSTVSPRGSPGPPWGVLGPTPGLPERGGALLGSSFSTVSMLPGLLVPEPYPPHCPRSPPPPQCRRFADSTPEAGRAGMPERSPRPKKDRWIPSLVLVLPLLASTCRGYHLTERGPPVCSEGCGKCPGAGTRFRLQPQPPLSPRRHGPGGPFFFLSLRFTSLTPRCAPSFLSSPRAAGDHRE